MAISPPGPRRPLTLDETLADLEAQRQASLAAAPPPAAPPPLPLIPELQGRPDPWASVGLPPPLDLPAFTPAEPTPPPPAPPGIIGRSMEALSEAGGRAAAYYAGNPAALSEKPPSLREQAEGAFGWAAAGEPEPGEDPGMAGRRAIGRGVGDVAAGLADPSQLALMAGIYGAAAVAPVAGTILGIGAMGMMAKSTFDQASNAIALGSKFGFKSPEFLQAATEAGGNTAILGALGYLGYRSMRRKPVAAEPAEAPPTPPTGEAPPAGGLPPGVPPPQPGEPLPPRGAPPGPPPADAPPRPPTIDPLHPSAELWDDAYRWAKDQGMDETQAIGVADVVVTETAFPPPSRPLDGAPKVEKQMGPGEGRPENVGTPPRTELEASTEPFVRATLAEFDRAITAAEAAGDAELAQRLRNERYKVLTAGSKAASAPTPARTPEAGSVAFPPTPAPGPTGSATATATAPPPPGTTVPGPRPGAEVTPMIPGEPVAPGAATPVEAAGARAAGQAPEVDALLAAARDQAAGGTGETLPPGLTPVSGRPEGAAAAAGVRPTPALPTVTGVVPTPLAPPVTGMAPPPAPIPSPVAGPLPAPPSPAPQPQEPVAPAAAPVTAPTGGRIRLKVVDGMWVAGHEGPVAAKVQEAFGTTEVPTPWGEETDPAEIVAELQNRNPNLEVVVDRAPTGPVILPPTRPAKPTAAPPVAVAPPRPAPAPPAPAAATEAEPTRRLRIGRGAHGQVEVIFPDSTHADLFSAPGRSRRQMRGEGAGRRGADWPGLASRLKVPEAEVGAAAQRYRDRIQRNIRALPEGERYEAPRWDSEDTEAPAPARAAEAPPEAVQGDIGRGPGGQGWIVRTYGRDKKVVSESEAYVNKDEAKGALKALQAQLGRNRFEARKKEISPTEEDWAAMSPADYEARVVSPGGVRDPNRLDLGELKEQAAAGSATTAYRAIRAAHSMGRPVHEGWYDVFPMLRKVPKTGERGRAGAEFKPEKKPAEAPAKKPTKLQQEIANILEFSADGYVEPDTDFSGFKIGDVVNVKGKKQQGRITRLWSVKHAKNAAQEKQIRRDFPSGRVANLHWSDGTGQNVDLARLSKATTTKPSRPTHDAEGNPIRYATPSPGMAAAAQGLAGELAPAPAKPVDVAPPAATDPELEAELGPGEEPVTPSDVAPADRDWVAGWGSSRSAAFQRATERVAEALRADLYKLTNDQDFRWRLVNDAKADWEYFGQRIDAATNQKIKNRANQRAAAKQKVESLEALYAAGRESMAGLLKGEKEGAAVTDRIHALIEGRAGLNRTQRDPGALPLTGYAYEMVRGWAEERENLSVEEAVAEVLERAPYYAERWTAEDVISDLERLAERLDKLNEQQVRFEVDIPGIGRKRLKSLLDIPPAMLGALSDANTAALKQVTDYRRRTMAERSAIEELLTEFQEPAHHDTLHRIADALTQDLALIAARPELKAEEPLAKTFMWDVRDPATGKQITTEQAINAIREGRGRLFARILSEYRLASALMADNIPFDVPDGGLADGEGILEAPGSRRPQQDLIPGFLEAVMGTPQKPVERAGKPASNFIDSELFTQEERAKAQADEERSKKAQKGLFNEAAGTRTVIFLNSPQDEFDGRYGPPPRRATEAQLAARRKWLDLVTTFANTGGSNEQGAPALRPAKDAEGGGDLRSDSLQPALGGGAQDADRGRAGGGARGGERGLAGVPGGEGAAGPGRSGAGRTSRKGIFEINDPRYAATHARPPKYDLIPARLRGVDANGDSYLSEDQQIGVAKAIEATEAGSGFLFEDGTGVGKTRELLAVAYYWANQPLPETKPGFYDGLTDADLEAALDAYRTNPAAATVASRENAERMRKELDRRRSTTEEPPPYSKATDAELEAYWEQEVGTASATAQDAAKRARKELDRRKALASAHAPSSLKHKVIIVSKSGAIEAVKDKDGVWRPSGSYADDSAAMGIPITYIKDRTQPLEPGKVYLGTYHDLRDYKIDNTTVLLLDEAHQLKNTGQSEMHSAGVSLIRKAKVTVFATATPGDKPYHMAYLSSIGLLEGKEMVEAMKQLGVTVKEKKTFSERLYKKLVSDNVPAHEAREQATETFYMWKTTNLKKMHKETEALFTRLTEKGTVVKREVDMSSIDVRTVMIRLPEDGHKAMAEIEQGRFDRKTMLQHQRRQQEPYKLEAVKGIIRAELAEGRQVVLFAARVNRSDVVEKTKDPETGELITRLLMSSEGTLKQLREWLKGEGIAFSEIHGAADENSKTAQARFQSGEAKVVIATYEKGGTGINLDDRGGAAPRTMVMMTPPFDSVSVVQAVGRIHRFTTRSSSRVHMLFTDHGIDKWNARILATKIAMLHAMVSGDIELLDPSILGGGEEALQAGTVHYGDAAVKLLKEGPPDQANGLRSAREWNYVIAQLKSLGVKITQKGGEFSIQTHEGFAIEGTLEKTPRALTYGVLRWNHDEEAGDLVKTLALAPSVMRGAKTSSQVAATLASLHPGREQLKKIISTKQYEMHARVLRDLGAIYGTDGKPGSFTIPTAEGHLYAGELVAAAIDWGGRAKPGQEGGFYWQRLGSELVQQATQSQAENRRNMDRLLARIEKGASFRDLYTRHQPALRELFGNDTDLFMRMLAVTFQAANTRGSFTLALKAYKQLRLGQPFAGFMGPVRRALDKLAAGESEYARGPKMRPFAMAATNEDLHSIAVDRHVGRFILGDDWNGSEAQIKRITEVLREAAKILGWTGREVQSAAWAAAQMEGGLSPEEILLYDDILVEKATEIRRFRAYFGDVAGPRSWTAPAVRAAEDREAAGGLSSDPTAELTVESASPLLPGVQRINAPGYARPLLRWMKPGRVGKRAGKGLSFRAGDEIAPGVTVAMTAIREGFESIGRIEWDGMWVGDLENAAAVYQMARNPSLEHGTFFFVLEDGTIGDSIQASSQVPAFIRYGYSNKALKLMKAHAADLEAKGHKVRGIISLHNHPSGDPTPSTADLGFAGAMRDGLGKLWMGMVVINHERAAIVRPTFDLAKPNAGGIYAIYREPTGFHDPDPFLNASIDSAAYYDPSSPFKIRTPDEMAAWATKLVAAGLNTDAATVSLMLLDSDQKMRMVVQLPTAVYTNPKVFKPIIARIGKLAGVNSIVAMTSGGGEAMGTAAREYLSSGYISDWLAFGRPSTFMGQMTEEVGQRVWGYDFPWDKVANEALYRAGRWPLAGDTLQLLVSGWQPAGNPSDHPAWPTQGGRSGGGAGAPPPPPPPPGGPGGPPDDDPDWWARRVRYARMRVRARLSEAAAFIDPRAFWDAFVLGVDAVLRGFRSFGRWLAELARAIPNIGQWGRRLWNYLKSIGAPVENEIQRPRGGRPFEEAAGRAEGEAGRGPVRPIPRPTNADLLAAAEGLLRGELGERADAGAGRPLGVDRPGDLAINIGQIRDEAGIRDAMVRIIRFLESRFGQARLKKTEPEMRAEALELGYTETEYLRMVREKGALTSAEIIAGRVLRQGAGVDFLNKWTTWRDATAALERIVAESGPPVEEAAARALALDTNREMLAGLQKFIGMMYGTAAAGAEAGRALRAHGMMVQAMTPLERSVQRLLRGAQPNERQLAGLVDALHRQDAGEIGRITRQLHKPGLWKTLSEYYINSILSGPATPAANVMGNLVHEALLRTPERGVAAFIEKLGLRQAVERALTGNDPMPTERVAGEAMAALRAQVKFKFGVLDALKLAWEAVGNEETRFMTGVKGEYYPPAIPGVLGKIVRTPGRVMEALDIGAKYSAMAAERAARVWRKVYFEAAERGGFTPEQRNTRMDAVNRDLDRWILLEDTRLRDPQLFQDTYGREGYSFLARNRDLGAIYKEMVKAADVSTFRDDTTKFTNYVKAMRGAYPWLTFIVPFIHTPERILVQAIRRTPVGLAKSLWNIRTGKLSGGAASDRLAQGVMGTMVTAAIYMLAKDGYITGGGPADQRERQNWLKTGKLPYAIKVGDKWVSMARIEPIATQLGFAADLAEAQDQKIAGDVWDKLHYSVINNIANKTYLQGIVSAAEAVGDPDRYGARLWKQMVGAAVPNLLASAARAIDPTIRQSDSVAETLMGRIPLLSESVPARLTGTGEPVQRGEIGISRFMSPFRYSTEAGPEANLERLFLETGYNPQAPPKTMTLPGTMGRRVELTRAEREIYARYAQRATAFARALTTENDWSGLDVYAKEEILKRIYRFTHDAARRDILASIVWRAQQGKAQVVRR